MLNQECDEPFENARESKATIGQIRIVNTAMFCLGLFGFANALLAYGREYDGVYDVKTYTMLTVTMCCTLINGLFYLYKNQLFLELYIYKKEADSKTRVLDVFPLKCVIAELIFII
jgi:hypothetical protein